MTFHDLYHDLFPFAMTLRLAVTFENLHNYPCFRVKFAFFFKSQAFAKMYAVQIALRVSA